LIYFVTIRVPTVKHPIIFAVFLANNIIIIYKKILLINMKRKVIFYKKIKSGIEIFLKLRDYVIIIEY
jgi:hypothetical protein